MSALSVVVVDDSPDLRDLLTLVIKRRSPGWRVVGTAAEGREAISVATDVQPDVVLLDVAMPVMDGMQALPLIREAAPEAVVVMLSGYPFATAGPPALEAGAHGYVEKADLLDSLIPQLERIIDDVRPGIGSEDDREVAAVPDEPPVDVNFDVYARLVRRLLSVPTGLVTLVRPDQQVFLGAVGLTEPWQTLRQSPLSHSFCQNVVKVGQTFLVTDARTDERVVGNLAIRDLGVIAYAGWPLTDHTGSVVGSLCAIDTEPRTWTEQELADLADLAAACSADLAHRGLAAELVSTNEELLRSNTHLSAFAAQVSHDLGNPLSVLSSSLQFLDEEPAGSRLDDPDVAGLLARARSSVRRMLDLVTSVLAYAVVDGQLMVEDVDVDALVASALEDLVLAQGETDVEVAALAPVRADPNQLRTAVQNLLLNAFKHGRGSTVHVSTASTGAGWTLSVADGGPGIDAADRERVLQPFVRLDTQVPGSGLGLATCRRIAEEHGGSIDIVETPGGGTTVRLTLPLVG